MTAHHKKTHIPPIINTAYQKVPDKIVGQMTIKFMDEELVGMPAPGVSRDAIADEAFKDSRAALQTALGHLRSLRSDINALPEPSDAAFGSVLVTLLRKHQRNIAVVAKRLIIIPDPSSILFRSGLEAVISLCERNMALGKTILAAGRTGLCDPTRPSNAGGLPHALTAPSQPDPKTHLCEPFFTTDSRDLRRDVVTHEYFHILGLVDTAVNNANDALRNANTIAQIVAFLVDRFRQANSDGQERAVPPLPMP